MLEDLIRGGSKTADHVDMLGSFEVIDDLISIVTNAKPPPERIVSNIMDVVKE